MKESRTFASMKDKSYNEAWRFIEENLPNYDHRDDILRDDILLRFVEGDDICDSDHKWIASEFQSDKNLVAKEIIRLETQFTNEALRAYYEKECYHE